MVEFGILALLFTLIMFAIADFGMLLNGWVAVSSATREAGRRAAMGEVVHDVGEAAQNFAPVPGVNPDSIEVTVEYCCSNGNVKVCYPTACGGPAADAFPQPLPPLPAPNPAPNPNPGDTVTVNVAASNFEVITPLVRPFFGCDSSKPHCTVPLRSRLSMRYEGPPPSP